jgi:peptidoglycan/LPS O-acetylase OafA/YrhL
MHQGTRSRQAVRRSRTMSPGLAATLVIGGLVMFVIAQFPSETEGEPPAVWDWLRHAVCFLGGVLACRGIMRSFNVLRFGGGGSVLSVVIGVMFVLYAQFIIEDYFDEGAVVAGVPLWLIQHAMIFVGGIACYVGMDRFREAGQQAT